MHASSEQIEIHTAVIHESSCGNATFYINHAASGGSTASAEWREKNPTHFSEVQVPCISMDDLIGQANNELSPSQPIVFKIDVEGYEAHALRGMQHTLTKGIDMIGFIEFDLDMLNAAGSDPEEFWKFLQLHFTSYLFVSRNRCQSMAGKSFADFRDELDHCGGHSDLLLVHSRNPDKYAAFVDQWTVKSRSIAA